MATNKRVYFFGDGQAEGKGDQKELLGGKGAGLAEMTQLGIPVPAGFTIVTEVCNEYYESGNTLPDGLRREMSEAMARVEAIFGLRFGDEANPLLVSVRSGARVSMPGMMDTVLNLGLNDRSVEGLAEATGNRCFAFDSYRRFIQMYGDVVLGVESEHFQKSLEEVKHAAGAAQDCDLDAAALESLIPRFKAIVEEHTGKPFPQDPQVQLLTAVSAVFSSWNNQRAKRYRKIHGIPGHWGTAVNVQAMVFGNRGEDCATGVGFTRNPSTGEHAFFGEYMVNAQGEDVVAGIRTPEPVNKIEGPGSLEERFPECYQQLLEIAARLEKNYRDMQDIEFTIQHGKVWMLQTRTGKRTGRAAVRIAVEQCEEGLIEEREAVLRIDPNSLDQLLHPTLDPKAAKTVLAKGLPASPGAASGKIVFHADDAERISKEGTKVLLVRVETSPEDIHGMYAAEGILTARGGMTSHAAVVARGMGTPCVAGCGALRIDLDAKQLHVGGKVFDELSVLTIDGGSGEVIEGDVPRIPADLSGEFGRVMEWADRYRRLKVRTNADTPEDAARAREFGAEGIGLCRTEHMFFGEDRIEAVRRMILAADEAGRREALKDLLPMQRSDFIGIFKAMDGLPVTIRLLDPPLHEFLPQEDSQIEALAQAMGVEFKTLKIKNESLHELNPMLGHRGCRLGITYPEIYEMQARAIAEASCEAAAAGVDVQPEIMVPLINHVKELEPLRAMIVRVLSEVQAEKGVKVDTLIGTMIEFPRACLTADKIAAQADFFSFGTNDLTQTTFGLSRDDAGTFLPEYVDKGIYPIDPFVSIDVDGVGRLVKMAIELGRGVKPGMKIGICGEHGGEPASVSFCHAAALDYVSCSPFRVPVARLSAAHAQLKQG